MIAGRSDAIPEGARLQLDPALDLDALGLTSYERIIAEAAQRYGMILADNELVPSGCGSHTRRP